MRLLRLNLDGSQIGQLTGMLAGMLDSNAGALSERSIGGLGLNPKNRDAMRGHARVDAQAAVLADAD